MKKLLFFLPILVAIFFLVMFAVNGRWPSLALSVALLASYSIPLFQKNRGAPRQIANGSEEG